MITDLWSKIISLSITTHLIFSFIIRLILFKYGLWQDSHLRLPYTDVDYYVFSDAATLASKGESPYDRPTYRYTPLLAWILLPNTFITPHFGKLVFMVFDILAAFLIYDILKNLRKVDHQVAIKCCMIWLYNPITATVSSRGNAESLMAFIVLLTIKFLVSYQHLQRCLYFSAITYAVSVHFKIYPITYSLPIFLIIREKNDKRWILFGYSVFPNSERIKFFTTAGIIFFMLTAIGYICYGWIFIQETYLYHLTRKDIRHNFSPYFYMFYLYTNNSLVKILSIIVFIPQIFLWIFSSLKFAEKIELICFIHTFVFVTFNKVCTSQYFLWYLSIIPLIIPNIKMPKYLCFGLMLSWIFSQGLWLQKAYYLEFLGINTFNHIWLAGLLFQLVNSIILAFIVSYYNENFGTHFKSE